MADFDKALNYVLQKEGLYSNDSTDAGGETFKGISRSNWPSWGGWVKIDEYKKKYIGFKAYLEYDEDLDLLVESFYRKNFWDKIGGDKINHYETALSIFDFAVNAGVKTSVLLTQKALAVKDDGIMGINTIDALNACNVQEFGAKFIINKIARYVLICKSKPDQKKNFYGWVCRSLNM